MSAPEVVLIRDPYTSGVTALPAKDMGLRAGSGQAGLVLALLGVSVALCVYDLYVLLAFATA